MKAFDIAMDTVTFGGHSRLKEARSKYATAYANYKAVHDSATEIQAKAQREVELLGGQIEASIQLISDAHQVLKANRHHALNVSGVPALPIDLNEAMPRATAILSQFESAFHVTTGLGAGSAAAIGSWALVSLIGSASTGASIAGLSGVAATNATLAWFGGGALAAGGAGMAGGAIVLGGLFAAPLIIYSAWSSHSKADDVDLKRQEIEKEQDQIQQKIPELKSVLELVTSERTRIAEKLAIFETEYRKARQALWPYGVLNSIWRHARRLLRRPFYSQAELETLGALTLALEQFSMQISEASS